MYFVWSFYAISDTTINWGTNPSPLGIWMVSIRFDLRKHFEINIFHSLTDHSHRVCFDLKIFEWWLMFWTVSAVQNPLELCLYILTCIFLVKYYCDIMLCIAVLSFELTLISLNRFPTSRSITYVYIMIQIGFTIFFLNDNHCSINKGLVKIWYTF